MATDDVPLYCVKQKFGKHKVWIVLKQLNGSRSREDKLVSVFSNKRDAMSFIDQQGRWVIVNIIGTKILNSVELCYIGRMAEAKANLEVYLNNPVGVGEHSDITGEVKKLLF